MVAVSSTTDCGFAPATTSRRRHDARLLVVHGATGRTAHRTADRLHEQLEPGDLFVVNDAATVPASVPGHLRRTGEAVELRLAVLLSPDVHTPTRWLAAVFGAGDWRQDTEARLAPPPMRPGDVIEFEQGNATLGVVHDGGRMVELTFCPAVGSIHAMLYSAGVPIQYSYHRVPLATWDQQTIFSTRPVAVEPPSSAFHLSWRGIRDLRRRGVRVAALTHATGISTTGSAVWDARLPFPEPSWIPAETVDAINETRARGGRVIAQGTGVTRALESAAYGGAGVPAGAFVSRLHLSAEHPLRVVDGLLTGLHEPGASHLELLAAFAPPEVMRCAYCDAAARGYLGHEYGDLSLVWRA